MSNSVRSPSVDPLAQANPASDLKIIEILDCDTGEIIDARQFIRSHTYGEIFEPRHETRERWKTETPKYVCSDCRVAVSLLAGVDRNWFYFRHLLEDGRCPAKTRGQLNQKQINAIRYESLVESEPHKRFKQLMYDCLCADGSFSDARIEKVRMSITTKGRRRKPDASAIRNHLLHAFEVQLSSTFFDVVLERQSFYRDEGAILVWVMPNFDPTDRTMMEDDIFFHNNCNVMVLDDAIAARSIDEGRLHFGCWYRLPSASGTTYMETWQYGIVPFDAVTIDVERQRAFYFDYESAKNDAKRLIAEFIEAEAQRLVQERHDTFRNNFEQFWLEHARGRVGTKQAWDDLIASDVDLSEDLGLPDGPFEDSELCSLLNALYWAKHLRQVGWEHEDVVKVGHHVFDKHWKSFALFCHCLWHFKQIGAVKKLDTTGKFQAKIRSVRETEATRRQEFAIDPCHSKLIQFLFPEPYSEFSKWISSVE